MLTTARIIRLLLALTVALASCVATVTSARDSPVNPQLKASNPNDISSSVNKTRNVDQTVSSEYNITDIPANNIDANTSHVNASKIDPEKGVRGPNCHRPDTEGVIRFIVMYATVFETRAQLQRFRLVQPNDDLVAAAAAARADGPSIGNTPTGNDSNSYEIGDAAASLHIGNMSLQLLGVTEYSSKPGLFHFDKDPEYIVKPLRVLLKNLTDAVPESVRPITCLLLRFNFGRSRHYNLQYNHQLFEISHDAIKTTGFRGPGKSHLYDEVAAEISPDEVTSLNWRAVNFLLGNFALEAADYDVDRRTRVSVFMPNITSKSVLEMNDMSIETILETVTVVSNYSNGTDGYRKELYFSPYPGLGMQESIMRFVNYNFSAATFEKNNQLYRQTYNSSCLAANLKRFYSFGPMALPLVGLGNGGNSCLAQAQEFMTEFGKYNWQEVPHGDQTMYAMSGVHDLLQFLIDAGIANVTHSSTVCPTVSFPCDAYISTVAKIESAARAVCRDPPRKSGPEAYYCFNLAALDGVLRQSLALPPETVVVGMEEREYIGWQLGLSLLYLKVSIEEASSSFDWMVKRTACPQLPASCRMVWTVAAGFVLMNLVLLQRLP